MTDKSKQKTWTSEEIASMLESNNQAVERAILRIYDNLQFVQERYDFGAAGVIVIEKIKNFAWFLRGQDKDEVVKWAPKSLTSFIAERQLKKFRSYQKDVMGTARQIVLQFVPYLTRVANKVDEYHESIIETLEWPEHIHIGSSRQRRYADDHDYDMYLKSLNKTFPSDTWYLRRKKETKQLKEIMEIQKRWRANGIHTDINDLDPQHIADRYDFWTTTHTYLD